MWARFADLVDAVAGGAPRDPFWPLIAMRTQVSALRVWLGWAGALALTRSVQTRAQPTA